MKKTRSITALELELICKRLFPKSRSWSGKLSERLGVNATTTYRWLQGETPIPDWVEIALDNIEELERLQRKVSRIERRSAALGRRAVA